MSGKPRIAGPRGPPVGTLAVVVVIAMATGMWTIRRQHRPSNSLSDSKVTSATTTAVEGAQDGSSEAAPPRDPRAPEADVAPTTTSSIGTAAPDEAQLRAIVELAHVNFKYYPEQQTGVFDASYEGRFTGGLEVTWTQANTWQTTPKDHRYLLTVLIGDVSVRFERTSSIRLPEAYKNAPSLGSRLLRHELDHAAIDLDPRYAMLAEATLKATPPLTKTIDAATPPDSMSNDMATAELSRRWQAVRTVKEKNQALYDDVCAHGMRPVPDRRAFFQRLYSAERLGELHFPYLDDVQATLINPAYTGARSPAPDLDPTEGSPAPVP